MDVKKGQLHVDFMFHIYRHSYGKYTDKVQIWAVFDPYNPFFPGQNIYLNIC